MKHVIFSKANMDMPKALKPWLTHQGSITDKLKQHVNPCTLEVLNHTWEKTHAWDAETLKLPFNQAVLHRDILMWAAAAPCWYARTILPQAVFDAEASLFKRLETTPLGELIHTHPDIERTHITPSLMTPDMPEYTYLSEALKDNTPVTPLWGRVSQFTIRRQLHFYLLEIFLPGLLRYCAS